MKAVMISISPKYCKLIASGKKTVEVRKTRPKIETPFKCYIYMTMKKPYCFEFVGNGIMEAKNGKVIGEFVCDRINSLNGYWLNGEDNLKETTCLDDVEIMDYIEYINRTFCLWRISDLKIYDKPKELGEFYRKLPDKVLENGDYDCRKDWDTLCSDYWEGGSEYCAECPYGGKVYLTRPPQSWCYVEQAP